MFVSVAIAGVLVVAAVQGGCRSCRQTGSCCERCMSLLSCCECCESDQGLSLWLLLVSG
ncbi:uncharacterized protein DS421_14g475070 [Arachis hypogaea]|nr:uncharacterized protein DS421_14g475070 [Arachis hypogaea]